MTVLDFGIAKMDEAHGGRGQTAAGQLVGTPCYMAPEQFRGASIDGRADVYALGAVVWEMLVGMPLWGDGTEAPGKIQERQDTKWRPVNPCELKPHIPAAMGAAVAQALAHRREQRWATMQDFALALAHGLTSSEWGAEKGIDILRSVAKELTRAAEDTQTAGRPMKSPHADAKTVPGFAAMPPTLVPGGVPIVAPGTLTGLPGQLTPPPAPVPRGDVATAEHAAPSDAAPPSPHLTTLGGASGPITTAEPIRARRRQRRALVALGAATAAVVAVGVLVASGGGHDDRAGEPATPAPGATSAIAIVTEPPGAAVYVDNAARGTAPVNVAATVGAEIEIRAELTDHTIAIERVRVTSAPATVRLALAPLVDAGVAVDAASTIDAAAVASQTIDAAPRRRTQARPPSSGSAAGGFDPDGLVQP